MALARTNNALAQDALAEEERQKKRAAKNKSVRTGQAEKAGNVATENPIAAGATAGSVFGPIGTAVGAGIGAAQANKQKKDAASAGPRPERRRLQKGLDVIGETKRKREFALATLSQAVFDWAAAIR